MTEVDRVGPMFKGKTPPVGGRQTPILQKGTKGSGCCLSLFGVKKSGKIQKDALPPFPVSWITLSGT